MLRFYFVMANAAYLPFFQVDECRHDRVGFVLPRCISPPPVIEFTSSLETQSPVSSDVLFGVLSDTPLLKISPFIRIPMLKCVDASPLLLVQCIDVSASNITVFVGSHAGLLVCLRWSLAACNSDTATPKPPLELWSTALPHRIEGAASLSSDGTLLFMGF